MGCVQSSEEDHKSTNMGSMTAIGRTERMIHRQKPSASKQQISSSKESSNDLKKQLKQSIRDRADGSLKDPDLDVTGRLMPDEIASRRETSAKTQHTTMSDGKIRIEYAFCSQRGYYPDGKCYLTTAVVWWRC